MCHQQRRIVTVLEYSVGADSHFIKRMSCIFHYFSRPWVNTATYLLTHLVTQCCSSAAAVGVGDVIRYVEDDVQHFQMYSLIVGVYPYLSMAQLRYIW